MEKKREMFNKIVKLRPCAVCDAQSTGYHFGVLTCEACKVRISARERKKRNSVQYVMSVVGKSTCSGLKTGLCISYHGGNTVSYIKQRSYYLKDCLSGYFDIK